MPEGIDTQVVDQPAGGSTTTDQNAGKPNTNDQQQPQSPVVKPGAAGNTRDYDKEIGGLRADLQKERKQRQQHEADLRAERANLEVERKRVAAALGVTPKSQADQDAEEIRSRFSALYPELAGLTKEDIEALRELKTKSADLQETTKHYWQRHGVQMVSEVQKEIQKELGGTLSDRQKQRIENAYATEAQANEEFLTRHYNGDKTLISEFAKQWIDDWFEPARRKVTQQEVQRQRVVPSGKDRGIITQGEKKIDVNDPKAVEDFLVKGFRERNGEFGRR